MIILEVTKCNDCPFYVCDLVDDKDVCKVISKEDEWNTEKIPGWCPAKENTVAIMPELKSKKRYKCFTDEGGKTYDAGYLDGYGFAERLLESVIFKFVIDKDGYLRVSCDHPYFASFDQIYWLRKAMEEAERTDFFSNFEGTEDICLEEV